jgi:hypothetical protein
VRSYYFGVLYLNGDVTAPNARMIVNGGEGLKAQNKYIRKWFLECVRRELLAALCGAPPLLLLRRLLLNISDSFLFPYSSLRILTYHF